MKIGNLDVYGVIYKITNKVNGKIYIGQTTRSFNRRYCEGGVGVERVYKHHVRMNKDRGNCNQYLMNSIDKHGFESFVVNEIFDVAFSKYELDIKERAYIKLYKSNCREYGYNFAEGGGNGKRSEDSITKNGIVVVCLNDRKEFISIQEASEFYEVPRHYVIKSTNRKFYSNYLNFDYLRFKKLKRPLMEDESLCVCCGRIIKLKKRKIKDKTMVAYSHKRYCNKCSNKKYRENKDNGKDILFGVKKVYTYNKLK